ncbi:unnamed protein product [Tilletia caries]|nr:unnamed protein product [Tilletia caries]
MNSLSSLLSFESYASSPFLPASAYIAVSDTLASSGSFIPISLARTALLNAARGSSSIGTGCPSTSTSANESAVAVVWVGCCGSGEVHWKTLLRKAVSLSISNAHPSQRCIDAADFLFTADEAGLKELLGAVQSALGSNAAQTIDTRRAVPARALVVVDDLSTLSWSISGGTEETADQLSRWIRALRIVVEQNNAALCTLQHASATSLYADVNAQDATDESLLRHLLTSTEPDVL